MRRGITSKLFLAILVTCLAVILAMALALRITFQHGFLSCLNRIDNARVAPLVQVLQERYVEAGNWQRLRHDRRRWHEVLGEALDLPRPGEQPRAHYRSGPGDIAMIPRLSLVDARQLPVAADPLPVSVWGGYKLDA